MSHLLGSSPPDRTFLQTAALSARPSEASSLPGSQPMAAITANPFPPTLPPILPGYEQRSLPPPLRRPSDTLPASSIGPVSPTSTTSSGISWRASGGFRLAVQTSSTLGVGNRTSPTQPGNQYNVGSPWPSQGVKRPRSPPSAYSTNSAYAPGISYHSQVPAMSISKETSTVHTLAPTSIPKERFALHVRQQPRAARAGPDGKDRRTIDPPPVLQILVNDFDPSNDEDIDYLKANDWVVHAKLISAYDPPQDMNTMTTHAENSQKVKVTRLLLGTTVSSPFYCTDDPDRDHAPKHPITKPPAPASPTLSILGLKGREKKPPGPDAHKDFPGTYFIFADVSVRKAGQYRLEFRLMKMEPPALQPGRIVPTISVVVSDVFNVVNAKDFDQVQPSTDLVKGLLDRGAGFPLKLKKGLREGQRRKNATNSDDDGEGGDESDDHEEGDLDPGKTGDEEE